MKVRLIAVFFSLFIIVSCATTKNSNSGFVSNPNSMSESVKAGGFVILKNIPFADNSSVPLKVKNECTEIGRQFSNSIAKYSKKNDINIIQSDELLSVKKNILVLNIQNVYSSGNAFIGHRKSVTVLAKLLANGEEINRQSFTRNSSGGFMGGFKGSCSVLAHTVNTLGNDVGKWLKTF